MARVKGGTVTRKRRKNAEISKGLLRFKTHFI